MTNQSLGIISDRTYFNLDDNNLTRIESGAFRDLLVKMRAFGGASFTFMRMNSSYYNIKFFKNNNKKLLKIFIIA